MDDAAYVARWAEGIERVLECIAGRLQATAVMGESSTEGVPGQFP